MSFELEEFTSNPSIDFLSRPLRKVDWLTLGSHYCCTVNSNMRKAEIMAIVIQKLVKDEVVHHDALSLIEPTTQPIFSMELEVMRLENVLKLRQMEDEQTLKLRQLEINREIELKKLEVTQGPPLPPPRPTATDFLKYVKLLPKFSETDVDIFFKEFENLAVNLEISKSNWAVLVRSVFTGKAQELSSTFSVKDSCDYDLIKETVLKAYDRVPEFYRQKFRNLRKSVNVTYSEFARKKERYFNNWCDSENVNKSYSKLRELVLIEEFKNCLDTTLRTYIEEREVHTLEKAAELADIYALTHKRYDKVSSNDKPVSKSDDQKSVPQSDHSQSSLKSNTSSPVTCFYCKKSGHTKSSCLKLLNKQAKSNALINAVQCSDASPIHSDLDSTRRCVTKCVDEFEPFVSDGFVALEGSENFSPVRILRDTGASQSLILDTVLPFSAQTYTSSSVLLQGVGGYVNVPLHKVYLKSGIVSGLVVVGVTSSLPVNKVTLILGNDLAGERVSADPIILDNPIHTSDTSNMEEEYPGIFPSCAVTRSQSHGNSGLDSSMSIDTDAGLGLDTLFSGDGCKLDDTLRDDRKDVCADVIPVKREILIKEQENDPQIKKLMSRSVSEEEALDYPCCYYFKFGVLMRKWRPHEVPSDHSWETVSQIVLPKKYINDVLSLAHETPMSGHLGVKKTYRRVLTHFYWPNVQKDVRLFCRSCHVCQISGKPNQKCARAPLIPIPVLDEPFSKVIVDCVGPMRKTKAGNQYLVTIMCSATRFPEAIPLRNITTKSIIKALMKFFTSFGLPKVVQSDQGSNFMSGQFQEAMYKLGIKQVHSSAYHPESQGALERFHQTLKSMLRKYCTETEKDWDEGVPYLMFAIRDAVQDSLGFSPFELVFGHRVRGPLQVLKESWVQEGSNQSVLDYVSGFKSKLFKAWDLARENLGTAQRRMKNWYDRKTKSRSFNVGDKVLVFLPVTGQPLRAKYHGPYVITKKLNDVNYVVQTPDRRRGEQVCHINMMKEYFCREENVVPVVTMNVEDGEQDVFPKVRLSNSEVLKNLNVKLKHLSRLESKQLNELIHDHISIFSDVPNQTHLVEHDVDVGNACPIKQAPYRLNVIKQNYLKKELEYLLENNIIEPSVSEWASPCILVPKPDNTYRLCIDYRKVNSITKTDAYPIPRMDDIIDHLGKAKFVSKIDLLHGYYNIGLTERAKLISAFVTPNGFFQYLVMPFGMKNAPSTFQRLIHQLTADLEGVQAYIDDVIIYSETWDEHIQQLRQLFGRLQDAGLTVNLAKSDFGHSHVVFLGHVVGQGKVAPVSAKVEAISKFPPPTTKKQVMSYLGMVGFYRKFCPNLSTIAAPLTNLLQKKVKFNWTKDCQEAFEKLKGLLISAPVLSTPDYSSPFIIHVDASDVGAGAVLLQKFNEVLHPISYYSAKFKKYQRNYSTIEKEALSLIMALQFFEVYLSGSPFPIHVYTDHNPLIFINRFMNKNQRLMRWSFLLQQFNLEINHIKGADNVLADGLSRSFIDGSP